MEGRWPRPSALSERSTLKAEFKLTTFEMTEELQDATKEKVTVVGTIQRADDMTIR